MVKKVLLYILSLLLIAALFLILQVKMQKESDVKYINGLLYDLDTEMDLLEHSKNNYPSDEYLEKEILHLIGVKLLLVSSAGIPIKELQGTPLKAIHRFIIFDEKHGINFDDLGAAALTIDNYLKRVEDEIRIEVKNRDEILRDPLKKEIKDRWGIKN